MTHTVRFRVFCLSAVVAAMALLAGCGGPLSVNILVTTPHESMDYQLTPEGKLTVTERGGVVAGERGKEVYRTAVGPEQMKQLKTAVQRSGFLMADPPFRSSSSAGPMYRAEVSLGLWNNQMTFAGAVVPSLAPIVKELNGLLPTKHAIPYERPPPGQSDLPDENDPDLEKYME